jgi:hypothetical protein
MPGTHRFTLFLSILGAVFWAIPGAWAQPAGDQLVIRAGNSTHLGPLPRGPLLEVPPIVPPHAEPQAQLLSMAYGPEGRLIVLQVEYTIITSLPSFQLFAVVADGALEALGDGNSIPLDNWEFPVDMGFSPDGRLFLLVHGYNPVIDPPVLESRLFEIDPETAEILGRWSLSRFMFLMSPSPRGFWLVDGIRLWHYSTETHVLGDPGIPAPEFGIMDMDTDSTGALWILGQSGIVTPPIFRISRFDPVNGALRTTPFSTIGDTPWIAVRRGCVPSDTVRCLQGGRFAAKVRWRDYEGREGDGRVAPSASADSGLFWFFEASNWDMLVKVIDGCERNGHFWVFAAGTTDVEYTLEVTDLETGEVFTSTNALGRAAPAVTETRAFSGCS